MRKSILFFALALLFSPFLASAGSEHNLSGFAWSSNIGWISFNSTNDHDESIAGVQASPVNYGVNINPSTGDLSGYAWSPNIGWIQFGGLSGFPTGGGTQAVNAKLVGSDIVGWAKATSANGYGWDGWISMAGTGYGVSQSGPSLVGFAWGSDVVGWVNFAGVGGVQIATGFPGVSFDALLGGLSIKDRTDIEYGSNVSLAWTVSDLPVGTSCTLSKTSSGGTSFTTVTGIATSSSAMTGPSQTVPTRISSAVRMARAIQTPRRSRSRFSSSSRASASEVPRTSSFRRLATRVLIPRPRKLPWFPTVDTLAMLIFRSEAFPRRFRQARQ